MDRARPLHLYVDCDEEDLSVVLAHSETEICGMAGRRLLATEARGSLLERLLVAAVWGYKRFRRYCEFQEVTVMLPHAAELGALAGSTCPAKIA